MKIRCDFDKCEWYGEPKSDGERKCYYGDPQCWRGWVEMLVVMFKIIFKGG